MGRVILYGELARRAGVREVEIGTSNRTVLEIIKEIAEKYNIADLLFMDSKIRPFYLILIDGRDYLSLGLLNKKLEKEKEIRIIPTFHGGFIVRVVAPSPKL